MQTGIGNVFNATRVIKPHILLRSSHLHLDTRRHASIYNPLNWVKERMSPGVRVKQSKEEVKAAQGQATRDGTLNVFETVSAQSQSKTASTVTSTPTGYKKPKKPRPTSHKYSTANFKISCRKLNMLGRQIAGKPIDYAILQMQFSEKRAGSRIKSTLATAKDHAIRYKRLDGSKLIVAESWVTKGPRGAKRLEPRGRGHFGIRIHPNSRLHLVLEEGKTLEQKKAETQKKKLKKIVSAAMVREDKPIRNPGAMWGW